MSNLSYWERRQVENMYHYMEESEEAAEIIAKLYLRASRYLSYEADDIFERYMTKHHLTEQEARRLINSLYDKTSIHELLQKLKEDGTKDTERKELITKLEAPAYQARLERLKQLQNQLDFVMRNVYDQEKEISTAHYVDLANEAYYRAIYDMQQRTQAAFSFGHVDSDMIDKVVQSKWSGANYSQRIWKNTEALAKDVKEELLVNLVTGRTNREAAEIIANKFASGAMEARRLVRTESNYIATEMNFKAYEEMGIEKYQFLATLDLKTSKPCRELDGKLFLVKERAVGKNCPPMHPWCRSTTVSVVNEKWIKDMKRAALDPSTGERVMVPLSMTYAEWYKKYVEGKPLAEAEEKKIKNRSADRKQYQEYKKILGDEIPDSFVKFQNMKYNDTEKWNELVEAYRDVNWQRKALQNLKSGETHSVPFEQEPYSVFDNYKDGKLIQRRYYGKTGKPRLDIDMTDHGNPLKHPVVPHRHGWKELQDGEVKREGKHDNSLKMGDKIANRDILKGGEENGH